MPDPVFRFVGKLVGICAQGASQFLHVEQLAGQSGDKAGGHRLTGAIAESHPEALTLPLHTAGQHAVCAADGIIRVVDHPGADGIGVARDQRP